MSDNERIQLVISGLDLAPGDEGPDDAIRMLRASGFAGQETISFIFSFGRAALAKVFDYIQLKGGMNKIGRITIERNGAKIQVENFSQESLERVFTEVQKIVSTLDARSPKAKLAK
jgi:hypothetical protein